MNLDHGDRNRQQVKYRIKDKYMIKGRGGDEPKATPAMALDIGPISPLQIL
jgi:hypothetical protein